MKTLRFGMIAAIGAMTLLGGCAGQIGGAFNNPLAVSSPTPATGATGTSTAPLFTMSQKIGFVKDGLAVVHTSFVVFCAVPGAPTFCRSSVDMAKIDAAYNDVQTALTAAQAAAAYNAGDPTAQQSAMDVLTTAFANYSATVAAFKTGAPVPVSSNPVSFKVAMLRATRAVLLN